DAAPLALADLAAQTRRAAAALSAGEAVLRVEHARSAAAALLQNAAPALALERMLIGWFHGELR
ncbi:MAG TPA: DNA polymerase III subunit delta', partial [Anaeromyxobacteraceae bacterium]